MLIPHKTAAALPVPEMRRDLGAALGASYRGGTWFESTAAHYYSEGFRSATDGRIARLGVNQSGRYGRR